MGATRRDPIQQRSRDRVERILAAAAQLLYEGGLDALSTRALAERSGVPVSSIYRYFENSDAIVAAFLDREMEKLDAAIVEAVLALRIVTLRSLIEAAIFAHLAHHQAHPATVTVWFGGRHSDAVRERVRHRDARSAAWLAAAIDAAAFLSPAAPPDGVDIIVRLADRMMEHALLEIADPEGQCETIRRFVDMVASYAERFATPAGLKGLPADRFASALADRPVHLELPAMTLPLSDRRAEPRRLAGSSG